MNGLRTIFGVSFGLLVLAFSSTADAAMCGRSCEYGGRYIPGPREVCYERGLNFCGPSRGGPAAGPGIVVPVPGVGGVGIGVAPPRGNCRTITVRDDFGNVRTTRRCD